MPDSSRSRLTRGWNTGKELTDNDVTEVISGVGFEMKADRPCKRRSNVIGNTPSLSQRSDGEFELLLTVFGLTQGNLSAPCWKSGLAMRPASYCWSPTSAASSSSPAAIRSAVR